MKKSLLFGIALSVFSVSNGFGQIGMQSDIVVGTGVGSMQHLMPVHGGMSFGLFYKMKSTPLSFGYKWSGNFYSANCKMMMPFYRNDYVHGVADIANNHTISSHLFYSRYELFNNAGVTPFIEVGGGIASYSTRWSATDPYQNSNDDCEGYIASDKFFSDNTLMAQGSTGLIFKLNKLSKKERCYGVWLMLAADYSRGGKVKFLNSKLNDAQFYYVPGEAPQGQTLRHGDMISGSTSSMTNEMPEENIFDKPFYEARHELLQFRASVVFFFGNCK